MNNNETGDRLMTVPQVLAQIGLGRTKLYSLMTEGAFPKPIKVGKRSLWSERQVQTWIRDRLAEAEIVEVAE